jgi:hypothetical protein
MPGIVGIETKVFDLLPEPTKVSHGQVDFEVLVRVSKIGQAHQRTPGNGATGRPKEPCFLQVSVPFVREGKHTGLGQQGDGTNNQICSG